MSPFKSGPSAGNSPDVQLFKYSSSLSEVLWTKDINWNSIFIHHYVASYPTTYWFKSANIYLLSFGGSAIQRCFCWVGLSQCLSWHFSQGVSWGWVTWRLEEVGGTASKLIQWQSCWLEASVSHHVDLSIDCSNVLTTWQLASPKVSDPRVSKQDGSHDVFYDPVSEVTDHHLCCVHLVSQDNSAMIREGTTQEHESRRQGSLGAILETGQLTC